MTVRRFFHNGLGPRLATLAVALVCTAPGCGDDPAAPATGHVTLHFDHEVDGDSLVLNQRRYANTAGNAYSVVRLRYFVSDVVLHRSDGAQALLAGVHYRDAESLSTRDLHAGGVPQGTYTALTFTFGLDEARNRTGALPNTLENARMAWPEDWGGGYHYMQLEGRYLPATGPETGFAVHTGRRQLASDPVAFHHHVRVTLPLLGFAIRDTQREISVLMNVNEWFANPNVYDFAAFPPNIMIDLQAQGLLRENGQDAFRIGAVARRVSR